MFNIEKYLEKFSKNVKNSEIHKNKILEIIEKQTGINIDPKNTEIKEYVLLINVSPAVKNKVFIYKAKILEEISKTLPDSVKIIDIR